MRLARLRTRIAEAPKRRKDLQERLLMPREQTLLKTREDLRQAEIALNTANMDADQGRAAKVKYLNDSSKVKDVQAYNALLSEAAACDARISAAETRALENMERIDALKAAELEAKNALKSAIAQVENGNTEIKDALVAATAALKEEESHCAELRQKISPEVLEHYQSLRHNKDAQRPVVVPLEGENCGGCHLKVTSGDLQQARRGAVDSRCSNCGMILYIPH
jgi:predicted  nucleic acid-binding Zn-ribbon protein